MFLKICTLDWFLQVANFLDLLYMNSSKLYIHDATWFNLVLIDFDIVNLFNS